MFEFELSGEESEMTYTQEEILDLIHWIESLSIIELDAIRKEWEQRINDQKLQ